MNRVGKRIVSGSGKPSCKGEWAGLAGLVGVFLLLGALAGCVQGPQVYQRSQVLMGTVVTLKVVARDPERAHQAMEATFREIRRLEQLLSTYIPESDLSRVNAYAGLHPVRVAPEVMEVLQDALEVYRITRGAFNIAVGPAVARWGIPDHPRVPSREELASLRPMVDLESVVLDPEKGTVYLPRKGMRLDVGGLGKGFASDRAYQVLRRYGIQGGIIAVAGDLRVFGHRPDGRPWKVGIRHPRREGWLARLDMEEGAVSTSGDYERYFMLNGIRYHHILDPRTLWPVRGIQSVTVLATQSVWADALATGVFVLGPQEGARLIESLRTSRQPAFRGLEAVIVDEKGQIWVSPGLRGRLEWAGDSPPGI